MWVGRLGIPEGSGKNLEGEQDVFLYFSHDSTLEFDMSIVHMILEAKILRGSCA